MCEGGDGNMEAREIILYSRICCICSGLALQSRDISLVFPFLSACPGTRALPTTRAAVKRGGLHWDEVREGVTSISKEAKKLPIEISGTSFSQAEEQRPRILLVSTEFGIPAEDRSAISTKGLAFHVQAT